MSDFVHLHTHSHYSMLDSCCKIPDLIQAAKEHHMPAVALTDYANLFGVPEFYSLAKKNGIRPVIGMEVYINENHQAKNYINYHLVLFAANIEGYRNLMALATAAYMDGFYYKPRIDKELLRRHSAGLIGTSACIKGEIPQRLLYGKYSDARTLAESYAEIFNGRFYIEIQRHALPIEKKLNRRLIRLANDLHLPLLATNDVHYILPEDAESHDILMCLRHQTTFSDTHRPRYPNSTFYFRSPEDMKKLFRDIPSAIENTLALAEQCQVELPFGQMHLPVFQVPAGFASQQEYLRHLAYEGIRKKYPDPVPSEILERLEYELSVIEKMNFPGYFLVVQDFINTARKMGVGVGPGRGSAAGSLVSYAIGITNIDPIRYQLLFERFLNPDRISMPDIDIDFDDKKRGQVIDYVIQKYGKDNVAQVIIFSTMAARGVIRDVARVLNIPLSEADRIAKMIPAKQGTLLKDALSQNPELQNLQKNDNPAHRQLIRHSLKLEGLVRQPGIHAAGIVITPNPVREYIPLYKSPKDELATQYDKDWIEKFGVLKIDFLGLTTLAILDETLRRIQKNYGVSIDLDSLPLDDPEVYRLFGEGETTGIFQFESQGMTEYLKQLKPTNIEDLIAMNALYRPGPMNEIPKFIARKHGHEPVIYPHPDLEPILKNTYGVIVYQEQVMLIAQKIAGFSMSKADNLRRAMAKKLTSEMLKIEPEWMKATTDRGYSQELAKHLWDQIVKFGEYAFNKSHSAAYALVAYQTAYLKTYYPVEFMASVLSADMADTDRIALLVGACRDMGIEILPPDINESEASFTTKGRSIRYGLAAVKNVGFGAIESIVSAREKTGPFRTLLDFCTRVDLRLVNKKVIESLVMSGACDSLQGHRAQLFAAIEDALQMAAHIQERIHSGQEDIFGNPLQTQDPAAAAVFNLPDVPKWTRSEELAKEMELMGFYASGHPLDHYRLEIQLFSSYQPGDPPPPDQTPAVVAGMITDFRSVIDRKNKPMAFVTLQGLHGSMEIVVFSSIMKEVAELIKKEQMILAQGKISCRNESAALIADRIVHLERAFETFTRKILLTLDYDDCTHDKLTQIEQTCARYLSHSGNRQTSSSTEWQAIITLPDSSFKALYRLRKFDLPPPRNLIIELQKILGHSRIKIQTN